ncbi:HAD family hydrolase [Candidatus Altiarchaeota archaeon]
MADEIILVLDVEGTLTDKSGRFIEEELLEKLRAFEGKGAPVVFCSGRDVLYLQEKREEWGLSSSGDFVAENGCVVFLEGKEEVTFDKASFPREQLIDLIEESDILEEGELDPRKKYMITIYPKGFLEGIDYNSSQIQDLLKKTEKILSSQNITVTYSSASVDIIPKGIDKGFGLQFLVRKKSMDPKSILFSGDGDNDVPAARFVQENGGSVAVPANAVDHLKELADYVAEKENGKGVLEVLDKLNILS